jgi:geranylgeranyl diphosphate synthase, type II
MIARAPSEAFAERIEHYRQRVDARIVQELARERHAPEPLRAAMEYAVLGPGKRVRPLLVYAAGELWDISLACLDAMAAAVELVHAYSLVHDDLPAMDDDDLRRGRPTTHRAFDEATAILAGDALQALAFELLCDEPALAAMPEGQVRIISLLARAVGPAGMVGGQLLDLQAENEIVTEAALEEIHRRKTGELIRAAIMMPSALTNLDAARRRQLDTFASDIGLVFQIRDDLLEVEQDTTTLGKNAGSDQANNKSTYPSVLGLEGARERADQVYERAMHALDTFGERASGLRWLSDFILSRSY